MKRYVTLCLGFCVAVLAGVGAASALTGGEHSHALDEESPAELAPKPGSAKQGASDADPSGGLPWAVLATESRTNASCVAIGRLSGGKFGQVNPAGRFRERPPAPAESCGVMTPEHPAIVHAAAENGRVVIYGRVGSWVESVEVGGLSVPLGAAGTFVSAHSGNNVDDAEKWPVVVRRKDGTTKSYFK